MKEIQRQIKEHQFYKVYLLTGDEGYLMVQAKKLLLEALVNPGDELNYTAYEGDKVDFVQLRDLAETFPFLSEKRVLLLDRTGALKSGGDTLVKIFETMPETTCIILCESECDKRSKVYKWIKKNGYVGEFLKKNQTEKMLAQWIGILLKKEKKLVRQSDVQYFLMRVGEDMFQIKNEVDKLISYVGERTEVTREDMDAILSIQLQDKIFDMIDAIAGGERQRVLAIYNDMILLKEPPLKILSLMERQYKILITVANMRKRGRPDSEIASVTGVRPYFLKKYMSQLRGYQARDLEDALKECVEIDYAIKSGEIKDQMGVELLLIALSEPR